jgi:hypothetical protein
VATRFNYEYGMELTWVGKYAKIARQAAKLQEAFPLVVEEPEEDVTSEVTEDDEGVTHAESEEEVSEAAHTVLGITLDQLIARFVNMGFSEDHAKREASRLGKDIIYFKLGLINEIDPYGGARENSHRSARVRRNVASEVQRLSNTITTASRRDEVVAGAEARLKEDLGRHIVESLLTQWKRVGYHDRNGLCGVQWNDNTNEIEITSPVHRTVEQAKVFYDAAYHGMTEVFGMPIETEADNGGGGHLHVTKQDGTGAFERDHMFNLCWEHCARPYIGWAFNDPNDMTEGPAPIEFMSNLMNGVSDYNFRKATGIRWAKPGHRAQLPGDDDRRKDYTVEFRIFQMARNWDEQLAHIMFVDKWAKAAEARDYVERLPPVPVWKGGRARFWTAEKAINEMRDFLIKLGLHWHHYQPIVERNITEKFTNYPNELT